MRSTDWHVGMDMRVEPCLTLVDATEIEKVVAHFASQRMAYQNNRCLVVPIVQFLHQLRCVRKVGIPFFHAV